MVAVIGLKWASRLYAFCLRVLKSASEATEDSPAQVQAQDESSEQISSDGERKSVDEWPRYPSFIEILEDSPLFLKFQQKQDPMASLFKTHLSWVEVQMGKKSRGNGDALAPEWYWVIP